VHGWTCSAAPVHDPEDGRLLGIIDLTGRMRTAHPHSYAVALETARAVEADLRSRLDEHDAELRLRYLARIESNREAGAGEPQAASSPTITKDSSGRSGWPSLQAAAR
jgi:transcriptional regulator of acetoin/glycerol metabolism